MKARDLVMIPLIMAERRSSEWRLPPVDGSAHDPSTGLIMIMLPLCYTRIIPREGKRERKTMTEREGKIKRIRRFACIIEC